MKDRTLLKGLVLMIAVTIAGGLFGNYVLATHSESLQSVHYYTDVLALVEENFVVPLDSEGRRELVESSIRGMTRILDPHTHYFSERAFSSLREEQHGSYYGLGITVSKRDQELTVVSPMDGTPAARLGIRAGDVISEIEGEPTALLPVEEAVKLLRGPKGASVNITIRRPGVEEALQFTVVRDEIPLKTIPFYLVLDNQVGYIRLSRFAETTADELGAALADLTAQNVKGVVLDLRGNPGGLLDQAIRVMEFFVPDNTLVVYTQGRTADSFQEYFTRGQGRYQDLPLVILVNEGSASASEIIAGAVQDHERGLVVGESTFGKGLVQSVYGLRSGNGGLALTTARYHTPLGRSIQRDYENGSWYTYYLGSGEVESTQGDQASAGTDVEDPEIKDVISEKPIEKPEGGIQPDEEMEPRVLSSFIANLRRPPIFAFFNFASKYLNQHTNPTGEFQVNDALLGQFREFVKQQEVEFSKEEFEAEKETVRLLLRREIVLNSTRGGPAEAYRIFIPVDDQLLRAIDAVSRADAMAQTAKTAKAADGDIEEEVPAGT